ncbi:unnamed protein product [Symbiodinium pilosum]|uniref:Ubiquitin-like domain-containing protein n=1 Tax=Symbiodinium pilosum TaxID=2952 RepID=A0A812TQB8_SYMPI|nr:unnamed protein product [Symbiodinium pilosum]
MVVGPAWTRGEMERPAGRKNMGTWIAGVYTEEQQRRLGVDEFGRQVVPAPMRAAAGGVYAAVAQQPGAQPEVEDMGNWKLTQFGYTSDQEARLGADHHEHCPHCNGLPVAPPTLTSSLSKALLNSPALLNGLCSMYFRRYDTNRNNILELNEVHTLCDDLHIGLGMTMSGITADGLKASIGKFSRDGADDKLCADEFPLWFAETLKESIEDHLTKEQEQEAAGFLPVTVRSDCKRANIQIPVALSMHDVIEGVAAVFELPAAKTCLLHEGKQLPSGETPLSELALGDQTELTAVVVGR